MIVGYFNVIGVPVFPVEADSPLIVDPDTVLTPAFTLEGLKPVARRDSKVLKTPGLVKIQELPSCNPLDGTKPGHVQIIEQLSLFLRHERSGSSYIIYYAMHNMSSVIF